MPTEITFLRHGLCTGNAADQASRKGDHSLFTVDVRRSDSKTWPLMPFGIWQSQSTGAKLRSAVAREYDAYFTSNLVRARETSHHLGFQNATWIVEPLLRERDWGGVENLPYPERNHVFERCGIKPIEDSMGWAPPRGEPMTSIIDRITIFLQKMLSENANKRVLVVTHGGPMHAMRVLQHRVDPLEYASFVGGMNYIRNCHVLHYTGLHNRSDNVPMYRFERSLFLDPNGRWNDSTQEIV